MELRTICPYLSCKTEAASPGMSIEEPAEVAKAVSVSYNDLKASKKLKTLLPQLVEAFGNGPDCLGIVLVHDLPAEFPTLRRNALRNSSKLSQLPESDLQKLESAGSNYLVGWSHGQEMMNGVPDVNKGSFYFNPTHDYDKQTNGCAHPQYESANVWPQIDGFREDLLALGQFIVSVGLLVAAACDSYASSVIPDHRSNLLETMVRGSKTCKARLLHYYPTSQETTSTNGDDTWCGEHLDHGCLTGLTSAMYLSAHTTSTEDESAAPEDAGLFIKSRSGKVKKVKIPRDCLAFQTGEALQVITSNQFCAVPHFVKGTKQPDIERNTMAVFMQPNLEDELGRSGVKFKDFARTIVETNYGVAS